MTAWCMILNPNKTKASVISRSRTVSPPHGELVLSVVSIRASPTVRDIVSSDSQRIGILRLLKRIFLDTCVTSLPFCIFFPILEYFSPVCGSAAEYHLQLLERQVYSMYSDQCFL